MASACGSPMKRKNRAWFAHFPYAAKGDGQVARRWIAKAARSGSGHSASLADAEVSGNPLAGIYWRCNGWLRYIRRCAGRVSIPLRGLWCCNTLDTSDIVTRGQFQSPCEDLLVLQLTRCLVTTAHLALRVSIPLRGFMVLQRDEHRHGYVNQGVSIPLRGFTVLQQKRARTLTNGLHRFQSPCGDLWCCNRRSISWHRGHF